MPANFDSIPNELLTLIFQHENFEPDANDRANSFNSGIYLSKLMKTSGCSISLVSKKLKSYGQALLLDQCTISANEDFRFYRRNVPGYSCITTEVSKRDEKLCATILEYPHLARNFIRVLTFEFRDPESSVGGGSPSNTWCTDIIKECSTLEELEIQPGSTSSLLEVLSSASKTLEVLDFWESLMGSATGRIVFEGEEISRPKFYETLFQLLTTFPHLKTLKLFFEVDFPMPITTLTTPIQLSLTSLTLKNTPISSMLALLSMTTSSLIFLSFQLPFSATANLYSDLSPFDNLRTLHISQPKYVYFGVHQGLARLFLNSAQFISKLCPKIIFIRLNDSFGQEKSDILSENAMIGFLDSLPSSSIVGVSIRLSMSDKIVDRVIDNWKERNLVEGKFSSLKYLGCQDYRTV